MDLLDLEIRAPAFEPPLVADLVRPLAPADLPLLQGDLGVKPQALKKIRTVHHQTARLLATGMKAVEVGAHVGLSQSRISILLQDPAFAELVSFYTEREDARFISVQEKLIALGLDAAGELHERLLDSPEEFTPKALIEIMSQALDRGGASAAKKSEHHLVLSSEDLQQLKAAATADNVRSRDASKILPDNRGAEVRPALDILPSRIEPEASSRGEGEGAGV